MHFDLKKFEQAALFVAPLVLQSFGVPAEVVNLTIHGIIVAEHAANGDPKTGAEKKAIALEVVKTGLDAVNAARPNTVDVTQLLGAVNGGIDATVAGIHAAHNIPVRP